MGLYRSNPFVEFEEFIIKVIICKRDTDEARRQWRPEYEDMILFDYINSGRTALHYACMYTSADRGSLVRLLLSFGCDTEATDYMRRTPLHECAIYGSLGSMQALLEAGCFLSPLDYKGESPAMIAERRRHHECASLLISANMAARRPSRTYYVEGDLLGQGAFGRVYKCHDPNINMYFSIKKVPLSIDIADVENEEIKALDNEVQIYSKWNYHRRIVGYFGTIIHKGEMIIFMEYVSNGSLKDSLNKSGPFSIKLVAKYTKQILEGLEFLHKHKIIHRDIKAANVLRDSKDDIKLADFGISKCVKSISSGSKGFTAAGTPHWMAPEVIKAEGDDRYDYRADVWSLGATILEMLTGKPPFHEFSVYQVVYKIGGGAPVDPYFPSTLDQETKSFLKKIFVHDPSKRADVKTLLESTFFKSNIGDLCQFIDYL